MIGPNLSEWAVRRRSLIVYFMIAAIVRGHPGVLPARPQRGPGLRLPHDGGAGGLARRDPRGHGPPGHRAHRAHAPGGFRPRLPDQLHPSRDHHDLRQSARRRAGGARCPTAGTTCARRSATSGTRCRAGWSGPASTTSSATSSASSTASPPTASPIASCAITSRMRARACCWCLTSRRSRSSAPRTSRCSSSSRASVSPRWASTIRPWSRRSRRRTRCAPRAFCRPATSGSRCGSRARSIANSTSSRSTSWSATACVRLGDVATVRRGYVDPPQPMFRVDGEPAIGIGIAMREGGDILALGRNISSGDGRDPGRAADRHRAASWSPTRRSRSISPSTNLLPRCGRRS